MIVSYLELLWPSSHATVLCILAIGCMALPAIVCLWRLYLHPLRGIPGPKWAACTDYYRIYLDTFQDGMVKTIPGLHRHYESPVVRIGPNYVHVNDPDVYHEIFTRNSAFLKWGGFWHNQGGAALLLSVTDPKRHRTMRAAMNPFFSKGAADRASMGFVRRLNSASDIISRQSGESKRIDLVNVIRSLTCNTMAEVFLGDPELVPTGCRSDLLDTLDGIGSQSLLILNFPLLQYLGAKIPPCIADSLAPGLRGLREKCNTLISRCQEKKNDPESFGGSGSVCEMILDKNPAGALSTAVDRDIMQHTLQFLVPNTDSTAMALSAAIFELIKSPAMRHRLRCELNDYSLESDDWSSLTKLPYLAAVVKETLRMYPSLPGLLPRVVPAGGRTIGQHYLPQGTIIAASIYAMHQNAEAYQEPTRFNPDRWLINDDKERDRCFTPFQKGNNACIGINLAYMQLYLGIAHTAKRFELALCESDLTDWDWIDRAGAKLARPVSVRVVQDYANAESSRGPCSNGV